MTPPEAPTTVLLPEATHSEAPTSRTILRVIVIVLVVIGTIALVRLLWQPIAWIVIAMFLAVALSGPVNLLARRMRRSLAITVVYLGLLLVPITIAGLIVPPLVRQGVDFVNDLPQYSRDLQDTIQKNDQLRDLNEDLGVTEELNKLADDAPEPDRRGRRRASRRRHRPGQLDLRGLHDLRAQHLHGRARARLDRGRAAGCAAAPRSEAISAALDRIGNAVGSYVGGAILQATVAGVTAFVMLTILGVPFAGALAIVMAFGDLIPLVGATLAAILIGVVTLFNDFPADTIIWAIFALGYQQFENYVIQPQIQKRAVELEPFVILVSVLFGGTLFGIAGALLAIPTAATVQISLQEWWSYRAAHAQSAPGDEDGGGALIVPGQEPEPPAPPSAAPA